MLYRNTLRLAPITAALVGAGVFSSHRSSDLKSHCADSTAEDLSAFSPKEFRSFKITKVDKISPNTKAFQVALPSNEHHMGMSVASFVMVKGPIGSDGKPTMKPYTPTSTNDRKGSFELVVKAYPNGVVSSYIDSLKVGDSIEVKGPINKLAYKPNMKKHIGMIAGGSGLTPMLQVIHEIIQHPEDKTEVHLVFANNTEEDILLKAHLDDIARKHKNIKISYVVTTPGKSFKGYTGYVSADVVKNTMPAPGQDTLIFVCGPPGFMEVVSGNKTPDYKQGPVAGLLKAAGYTEDMVFKF